MALPTNFSPGDAGHVEAHEATNVEINRVAGIADGLPADLAEYIRDTISETLVQGANVTITKDDTGNTITIASTGGSGGGGGDIDASQIVSGLISPDRLGSGPRDGTKVLRDDGVWTIPSGGSSAELFSSYPAGAAIFNSVIGGAGSSTLGANTLYLTAVRLWANASITRASFRITSPQAGSTITPVLYARGAGNLPTAPLIIFPAVSGSSSGLISSTLSAPVTVPAGVYLIGLIASAAVSVTSPNSRLMSPPLWGDAVGGDSSAWQITAISKGPLSIPPADLSSVTGWEYYDPNGGSGACPVVWLTVAT